jgi:RNA polymerase sigma-70 factor (ECF subfamily)
MTKLWSRYPNFDSLVNIRAFLYITTRNSCLDYLKFNRRRGKAKEDLARLMGEDEDTVLSRLVKAELFESIREEIENLPPQRKTVFKMFYIDDLSMEEIANKLKTTQSTVRGNKFQAIEQLKKSLSGKKILGLLSSIF